MIERSTVVVNTQYGIFETFDEDLITEQLVKYSAHTRNELAMVLDHIEADDTVVDVGAHIGTYSIPIAQKLDKGHVYSIEAHPETYQLLRRNIVGNGLSDRITAFNFLVAGENQFYTQGPPTASNSGANYYLPSDEGRDLPRGTNLGHWIQMMNLNRIDLIKMDVEGLEYTILSSLTEVLSSYRPKLYIEIVSSQLSRYDHHPSHLQTLLDSIGYDYYVNTYHRNSDNDQYVMTKIDSLDYAPFFDVLALPRP